MRASRRRVGIRQPSKFERRHARYRAMASPARAGVRALTLFVLPLLCASALSGVAGAQQSPPPGEVELLRREIEALKAQQRKYQERIDALSEKVESLTIDAQAQAPTPTPPATAAAQPAPAST